MLRPALNSYLYFPYNKSITRQDFIFNRFIFHSKFVYIYLIHYKSQPYSSLTVSSRPLMLSHKRRLYLHPLFLFTSFQQQTKIHLKFASQVDFGFVVLRFRTPLAVNAKACLNSNHPLPFVGQYFSSTLRLWLYSPSRRQSLNVFHIFFKDLGLSLLNTHCISTQDTRF